MYIVTVQTGSLVVSWLLTASSITTPVRRRPDSSKLVGVPNYSPVNRAVTVLEAETDLVQFFQYFLARSGTLEERYKDGMICRPD